MSFSYIDHTGDVGIDLAADSLEELFTDASLAFIDILSDPSLIEGRENLKISVQADTAADLLLLWLEELLYLFETRGLLAKTMHLSISTSRDGELSLEADLSGEGIDLSRHPSRVQIKAVTYHQLEVRRDGERWLGRVIFDI